MSKSEALDRILKLVADVARRIRIQNVFEGLVTGGTIAVLWVAFALALFKSGWFELNVFYLLCIIGAIFPIGSAVFLASKKLSKIHLAQRLDHSHKLHDRLSTAVSLSEKSDDSDWALTQIRDAAKHANELDVALASPFKRPFDLLPFGAALLALAALFFYQLPDHQHALPVAPVISHAPVLDSATLAFEKEKLEDLKKLIETVDDEASKELIKEVDELLKAVEDKKISEKQFLERLKEIEKKFEENIAKEEKDDVEKLADALKKAAEALEKDASKELKGNKEAQKLVDALKKKDLAKASKAMEKLAKQFLDPNMSEKDLEKLAKLMEKFSDLIDLDDPAIKELMKKNQQALEKLAKKMKKNKDGKLSKEDEEKLDRAKKEMKKLEKKAEEHQKKKSTRELKKLKRMSKQIGERGKQNKDKRGGKKKNPSEEDRKNFKNESGRSGKKMSEDMKKSGKQQKRDNAREAAKRQLDDLKESMKRSSGQKSGESKESKESQQRGKQMKEFLDRAKGKQGTKGEESSDGKEQAQRSGGEKKGRGAPKSGQGDDKKKNGQGSGEGDKNRVDDKKTDSKSVDITVKGDKGKGATKSEIIKAASEEGFANRAYKDVFDDYESVVEEVMEKEKIPPGYRYYIKQYFKIIQPKDE